MLFLEASAAASSRGEGAEPAPRVSALLHAAVVLHEAIILVAAGPVRDRRTRRLAAGARVGGVPVGRDLRRGLPGDGQRSGEAALGCGPVALVAQQRVDQVPLPVDRAIPGDGPRHRP